MELTKLLLILLICLDFFAQVHDGNDEETISLVNQLNVETINKENKVNKAPSNTNTKVPSNTNTKLPSFSQKKEDKQ